MNRPSFLLVPLLLIAVGCTTEQRAFDISLQNHSSQPITIWTVKENGPLEDFWMSPEQYAMLVNPPPDDKLPPRHVIPPDKTGMEQLSGDFDKQRGRAYVRIYEGTPTLNEMLSVDRNSVNRLDLPLEPGWNSFIIADTGGVITATKGPPPSTQPSK